MVDFNEAVKKLREKTSAGIMSCKEALTEAGGDINKAIEVLRKKGIAMASKKASRAAKDGCVYSYIHMGGKIGVLVEVNCETDFVAKGDDFKTFVKEIAMQITASHPQYTKREDVPEDLVAKEKEIFKSQIKGKPENIVDKIVTGKLDKFYEDVCLLDQPYIKDPNIKIKDFLTGLIAKIGENVVIRRFTRYQLGEEA
ncbi:MAG: translation elongation factor Ts [Candidatus Omnitrophica bacterium]|nr:translation elongation factor Ts [Candidatus Omnitrophota bacterium]